MVEAMKLQGLWSTSFQKIILEFNNRNLKTVFGGKFTFQTINTLLRNPVYAGTLRVGHYARGKFSRVAENGIIEIENAVSTTTLRYSDASF